jgi:hypothetical protein
MKLSIFVTGSSLNNGSLNQESAFPAASLAVLHRWLRGFSYSLRRQFLFHFNHSSPHPLPLNNDPIAENGRWKVAGCSAQSGKVASNPTFCTKTMQLFFHLHHSKVVQIGELTSISGCRVIKTHHKKDRLYLTLYNTLVTTGTTCFGTIKRILHFANAVCLCAAHGYPHLHKFAGLVIEDCVLCEVGTESLYINNKKLRLQSVKRATVRVSSFKYRYIFKRNIHISMYRYSFGALSLE